MGALEKLSSISHELPAAVLQDIDKRISDWLAAGGHEEDPYIYQQLRYAENYLEFRKGVSG